MAAWTLHMTCEDGGSETVEIEADTLDEARGEADSVTRDWIKDGDWGTDGASVDGGWELLDEDGETLLDEDGETLLDEDGDEVRGDVLVSIAPDHSRKIYDACGGRWDGRRERSCGDDPDDHDWTSEGEGGCDSNPGVWATGGTSMSFASHCRACGLHRSEHHTGSQRNPGEHDTVEYTMPERWCEECQSEECECETADAE